MNLGQVFTNPYVASYMVSLLTLKKSAKILDPCFGRGAFIKALSNCGYNNLVGYEIDTCLYSETINEFSGLNMPDVKLYNTDFLNSPDVLFDGIIMNPPYIRQEKINGMSSLGITKNKLKSIDLFKDLPQNANLYMYFIVKAISLLKDGGELVIIFPGIWMNSKGGLKLRSLIASNCAVAVRINITGNVFDTNALVDVVILKLIKTKALIDTKTENIYFNGISFERKKIIYKTDLGFEVPFSAVASAQRGLSTGCNNFFINPQINDIEKHTIPIISSPKNINGFDASKSALDRLLYLSENSYNDCNDCNDCNDYIGNFKNLVLNKKEPQTLYNKILANDNWYRLQLIPGKGIIFGYYIRNEVKFIMNETEYQVRDNFYIIRPKIDSLLLFALLNNYYTYYQLECLGKLYGAGLLKIQRYDLENLKFPDYTIFSEEDINILKNLSKKLIDSNNKAIIKEITGIISKYASVNYEKITEQYGLLKKQRLGD